jgi:hypothetical protein
MPLSGPCREGAQVRLGDGLADLRSISTIILVRSRDMATRTMLMRNLGAALGRGSPLHSLVCT